MAKAKWWAEVRCDKHGKVEAQDKANLKRVVCAIGLTKHDKFYAGCPQCKTEKKNES